MTRNIKRFWHHGWARSEWVARWTLIVLAAVSLAPVSVLAQTEGEYLYNITMLRAAPGHFTDLISTLEESFEPNELTGDHAPFWLRHSEGDRWDFMLIYPMGDYGSYYSPNRIGNRTSVSESGRGRALSNRLSHISFSTEDDISLFQPKMTFLFFNRR